MRKISRPIAPFLVFQKWKDAGKPPQYLRGPFSPLFSLRQLSSTVAVRELYLGQDEPPKARSDEEDRPHL